MGLYFHLAASRFLAVLWCASFMAVYMSQFG